MGFNDKVTIFIGNIIHCAEKLKLDCLENGFVAVQGKHIISIGNASSTNELNRLETQYTVKKIHLKKSQMLIPGFIDTHIHAPQYPNSGLGYDKTLLDWLNTYTFKLERQYTDLKFAKYVFDRLVRKLLDHGTTTACYFGSLFSDASLVLVDSVIQYGQRALVGKVNMTKSPFNDYVESEENSLKNTIKFIDDVSARQSELVQAVITPRFALSTNMQHMKDLGRLAMDRNLCIQTHISENVDEVHAVEETYGMSYSKVYDEAGILTSKTVLAHGIHLTDEDLKIIAKTGSSISHCPSSNTCLKSGICDLRRLFQKRIKVGLGSDISGGPSPSMRELMKLALDSSIHLSYNMNGYKPLDYSEVFYLATLGGAEVLSMEDKIGNFIVGKEFDALIIDMDVSDGITDYFGHFLDTTPIQNLQKFIYCGDDRNIVQVFVAGNEVKNQGG